MRAPALITRQNIPKDDDSSHPPTIVGEKHELALLGFTSTCLNEQTDCDFPEDLLLNWISHVQPEPKGEHVHNTPLLLVTLLD